ncbi:MAG: hypothetical protein K5860_06970 [Bacteroidales bacterium]|nr:hypothetical protein [Bacteroidales bacterium]
MKHICLVISLLLGLGCYSQSGDSVVTTKSDVIMSKSMLGNTSLSFISSYEYTADGFVFLSTGKFFTFLGNGGLVPYLSVKTPVSAFTISANNVLKAISGRQYGVFDEKGKFVKICDLPRAGMGLSGGSEATYVFDKLKTKKNQYYVYAVFDDATYSSLIGLKAPITSVQEVRNGTLFITSESKLYYADIQKKSLTTIVDSPDKEKIISTAICPKNGVIYFSTTKNIYRITGKTIETVVPFGGLLKYTSTGLLVFQPEKSFICRLRDTILVSE